ncbi:tyrosine-type recombinase/integrase [Ferribacterium limneticum]|uniref:tyrosine-type recombinase/integrase n=1 Tax=Ferribacterium limneticum TaxID=76259 RepID=UPI001CFC110F|nr:site-specific integrase [Ferribacterium limneticum]UCV17232.1 tyrosine-type recombinase/integrase [Ferribacterium limneticum]
MALTVFEIKSAKEGMHADGGGLYLRVQTSGAKSWIFRFQLNGKRREMGIGTLADKSLTDARGEASQLATAVRSGIDPIEDRKQKAATAEAAKKQSEANATTFREVATEYIANHKAEWKNAKHAAQWSSTLETYAGPIIGDKPAGEVVTEDILKILSPIWTTKTETATRLRGRIELVLTYAKAMKLRQGENPALWRGHLEAMLPKPTKLKNVRHHPALPYARAAEFMVKLRAAAGSGARALEFAILTAARSGEVRLATWDEIDMNGKLWTIPAERMKAKREHWVPLSEPAIAMLKELPKIAGNEYLFPGDRDKKPLSDMTLTAIIRRFNETEDRSPPEWIDPKSGDQIVPHGFRSTFRDWAAEVSHYPREVVEHALAHSLPDKVEAAYARGTMIERRRPLMEDWAAYMAAKPGSLPTPQEGLL